MNKDEAVIKAARELRDQLAKNDFTDSLGHQAKMLRAFQLLTDCLNARDADDA